jgi:hypothetical protein
LGGPFSRIEVFNDVDESGFRVEKPASEVDINVQESEDAFPAVSFVGPSLSFLSSTIFGAQGSLNAL